MHRTQIDQKSFCVGPEKHSATRTHLTSVLGRSRRTSGASQERSWSILGLSWNTFYQTVPNAGWTDHNEDSRVDLAMNLGFGYQWDRVDGRISLFMPDLGDVGEYYGFLMTLGCRFTTL